jgi:hypothetical protein
MIKASFALSVIGWLVFFAVHLFKRTYWDNPVLWIPLGCFMVASMLALSDTLESGPRIVSLLAGLLGLANACLYAVIYIFLIFGAVGKHGAVNHLLAGIPA